MRLTGGEGRGRRLSGPGTARVRPTADRVREALFAIAGGRVSGAAFLDAFAGTGAVGVEALSRGAARAVFLERDPRMLRLIARNLGVGEWPGVPEVIPGEVERSFGILSARGERFGIIFLDPPYDQPAGPDLLAAAARLLRPEGLLIVEHAVRRPVEPLPGALLASLRAYRYGDTGLATYILGAHRPER